jgi:hypothetical protein
VPVFGESQHSTNSTLIDILVVTFGYYIPSTTSFESKMNRPDSGPGLDQGGDRNLRPRRASTTRTFFDPSPSASSARHPRPPTSSTQANTHYYTRTASGSIPSGQRSEKDDSDGSSETGGEQLQEVSKLEIKREKNRLKQRNLRREFPLSPHIILANGRTPKQLHQRSRRTSSTP